MTSIKRGAFILFEGVDRCGKTTQCKLLVENLIKKGIPAVGMRFPGKKSCFIAIFSIIHIQI